MHRFEGCLIGGAVGDALGWPVEFLSYDEIIEKYGENGITGFILKGCSKAEISDDTQMTIFTAEGLLRAFVRGKERGICHIPSVVHKAYQRWLITQGENINVENINNGWLIELKELYHRRAPGGTCISAIRSGIMGTIEQPINNSKGCGGVMRVAPVGLVMDKDQAFQKGVEIAAITHGHPSGYLAAGVLAKIINCIIEEQDLIDAITASMEELKTYKGHEECLKALENAVRLAEKGNPSVENVSKLGEGWIAEEALAIAVYCSLVYKDDFRKAVLLAVNHSGDSDSTGAITGNILGTYLGIQGIPEEWTYRVELSAELRELAGDLYKRYRDHDIWRYKYPGA